MLSNVLTMACVAASMMTTRLALDTVATMYLPSADVDAVSVVPPTSMVPASAIFAVSATAICCRARFMMKARSGASGE